ncbi:MAG: glycoside hydrolase family 2 protein [Rectinemataceae bacterium]
MRQTIALDRSWFMKRGNEEAWLDPSFTHEDWEEVSVPHSNLELPFNGFDEHSYQFISTWIRDFDLPKDLPADQTARRVFVDFEAVMSRATVFVNGLEAGRHSGGFTPFSIEISSLAKGGRNTLAVIVDSTEDPGIPPFGHVVDYLCYGGIYREVAVRVQERSFIIDAFALARDALLPKKALDVEVRIDCLPASGPFEVEAGLLDPATGKALARGSCSTDGDPGWIELHDLEGILAWEPGRPTLYELIITLKAAGTAIDAVTLRVGFRQAEWKAEGFFLNGKPFKIRGLNRHQAWPYVGYAMPERAQRRDAEILKRELGVNLVRSSHYPPSRHFLDACDELGLLVFEELPGWQHIGDAAWKKQAIADLEDMIVRDRNHPSIVLWGTRINESPDDHDFYAETARRAHGLDPSRATGGVRYIEKSELLEDVYAFNDFVHDGGPTALKKPRRVTGLGHDEPFLVTEHNGHMFPTKRFDQEERLAEHARRHARVLDAALGDPGIAGAIGWCAFDYNTHKDFGSGDRVCYHGVSDMFRIPKYAAAVYASQVDPSERIVLEAATLFAKGERSGATLLPIDVWTNCDEIVLWRAGERVGSYGPDYGSFPNLPHPPVVIRDLIGDRLATEGFSEGDQRLVKELVGIIFSKGLSALRWRHYLKLGLMLARKRMSYADAEKLVQRFTMGWGQSDESVELVGFVKGEEVARRRYGGDARATVLEMVADDAAINADGIDVTRIVLRLLDQYGNIHPFAQEALQLSAEGPGCIIGPRLVPLSGGVTAFWLRSAAQKGTITIMAKGSRFTAGPLAIEAV